MDGKAGDTASVLPAQTSHGRWCRIRLRRRCPPGWEPRFGGIWQLIAAVLITAAALWFAGRASDLLRHLILAQLLAFALERGPPGSMVGDGSSSFVGDSRSLLAAQDRRQGIGAVL
jgi:hypothetical protein